MTALPHLWLLPLQGLCGQSIQIDIDINIWLPICDLGVFEGQVGRRWS